MRKTASFVDCGNLWNRGFHLAFVLLFSSHEGFCYTQDMQYIEAPSREEPKHSSIFLAGGITNCPDWQSQIIEKLRDLDVTVFNPRRKNFPIDNLNAAEEQIRWEYERLRRADLISFWFSEGSSNPIVLFELGAAFERTTPLVIGVHPAYLRKQDVEIQTMLRKPNLRISYNLDELIDRIRATLSA